MRETCGSVTCEKVVKNPPPRTPIPSRVPMLPASGSPAHWLLAFRRARAKCSILGSAVRSVCPPREAAGTTAPSGTAGRCGTGLAVTSVCATKGESPASKRNVPRWSVPR